MGPWMEGPIAGAGRGPDPGAGPNWRAPKPPVIDGEGLEEGGPMGACGIGGKGPAKPPPNGWFPPTAEEPIILQGAPPIIGGLHELLCTHGLSPKAPSAGPLGAPVLPCSAAGMNSGADVFQSHWSMEAISIHPYSSKMVLGSL
mmetsp:Transcript_11336/g.26115  ORF Transcript_11336/g.26115 Transcript_11336/m.26115 type:complete len:144 (+) Transcript_11336:2758-3189(+)